MEKYNSKKLKNQQLLSKIQKHVNQSSLDRIAACCDILDFIEGMTKDGEVKRKMIGGITCKNRFCPLCSWRKAKKDAMVTATLMKYIIEDHDKVFIFLTLTIPNVAGVALKDAIKAMNLGFKKLFKRKDVMAMSHGYMRKLEITYNSKMKTFHPHFHSVIAVNQSYFTDKTYISQQKWLEMWRDCMGDPSITQVDVRKMKMQGGVQEIAKYTAKDADYLQSNEVFDYFYTALKGAQVLTYNGLFKDAKKLYDEGKLENYKQIDETEYIYRIVSEWFGVDDQYKDIDKRLLTDEEKLKYNGQAMGESEEFKDE